MNSRCTEESSQTTLNTKNAVLLMELLERARVLLMKLLERAPVLLMELLERTLVAFQRTGNQCCCCCWMCLMDWPDGWGTPVFPVSCPKVSGIASVCMCVRVYMYVQGRP